MADWRIISGWPTPQFDPAVFGVVNKAAAEAERTIRTSLPSIIAHPWADNQAALAEHFGTNSASSCFTVAPHDWANFHEPQITGGFAHFLMDGSLKQRTARCTAFVRAALECCGSADLPEGWSPLSVEAVAEEERIDLLVELQGPRGVFGAAIEAKFSHRLTQDQLGKAARHMLETRKWDRRQSAFIVIGRKPARHDHQHMATDWHPASWWCFLRALDRMTADDHDCEDYRRFRRTVWQQAY